MRGKTALIGFLVVEAIVVAIWAASLLPLAQPGAPSFHSTTGQIWSGGAWTTLADNFRRREIGESAAPFKPYAELLWASLLMAASVATTLLARVLFVRSKGLLAGAALALTLVLGAGAVFFIVEHWGGSTMYPPGAVNTSWLYMITRSALIQVAIAYVALLAYLGLIVADFAKPDRPLGFGYAALNWLIAAVVWIGVYVVFYVMPAASAPAA